jgi:uncharacterized protein
MKGTLLKFYVHENRRHANRLLYEWLLERARQLGIHGGSAFRAIAGYGRHGVLHEERFFELAGDLALEVEFALSELDAQRLIECVRAERISVFYVCVPMEFGTIDGD